MAYQIEWADSFSLDMQDLIEVYQQYYSQKKAEAIADAVFTKTNLLKFNPRMGKVSNRYEHVYSIPLTANYRLYYSVRPNVIEMLRIIDMRLNPDRNPLE